MIKRLSDRARGAWTAARRYAADLWTRLTKEPGYADALARVVIAAVALLAPNRRIAAFVTEITDALATLVRTLLGQNERPIDLEGWKLPWG